jgi:hypothetical protein
MATPPKQRQEIAKLTTNAAARTVAVSCVVKVFMMFSSLVRVVVLGSESVLCLLTCTDPKSTSNQTALAKEFQIQSFFRQN